eukprot:12968050-Alexandrium_andersonii.AAC.1
MVRRRRRGVAEETPTLAPDDNARLARRLSGYNCRHMDAAGEGDDTLAIALSAAMAYLQVSASSVARAVGGNSLDASG